MIIPRLKVAGLVTVLLMVTGGLGFAGGNQDKSSGFFQLVGFLGGAVDQIICKSYAVIECELDTFNSLDVDGELSLVVVNGDKGTFTKSIWLENKRRVRWYLQQVDGPNFRLDMFWRENRMDHHEKLELHFTGNRKGTCAYEDRSRNKLRGTFTTTINL